MHRKHDVQAFPKHRQKHRRAMFLSEHCLNIPSLRNGKHPIVKNCENPPALHTGALVGIAEVKALESCFTISNQLFSIQSESAFQHCDPRAIKNILQLSSINM